MRTWRSIVVAQSGLVWAMTGKSLDPYALLDFIETGVIGEAKSQVMPFNPAVLQAIQDSGSFFEGAK